MRVTSVVEQGKGCKWEVMTDQQSKVDVGGVSPGPHSSLEGELISVARAALMFSVLSVEYLEVSLGR